MLGPIIHYRQGDHAHIQLGRECITLCCTNTLPKMVNGSKRSVYHMRNILDNLSNNG